MTNEGGGVYSPDHWDPCPCEYCIALKAPVAHPTKPEVECNLFETRHNHEERAVCL